jgi:2'-5' RNA ligase
MIRLFVGLDLPEPLRQSLALLSGGIPNARWEPAENLHVTLRFVGELEEPLAQALHDELDRIDARSFALTIAGFDAFARGHQAHTLWARVENNDGLSHLRDRIEAACVRLGLTPETRKFTPHVTVARLRGAPIHRLQDFLARNALFHAGPLPIRRFILFQSRLGRGGAVYTQEAEYWLNDPDLV